MKAKESDPIESDYVVSGRLGCRVAPAEEEIWPDVILSKQLVGEETGALSSSRPKQKNSLRTALGQFVRSTAGSKVRSHSADSCCVSGTSDAPCSRPRINNVHTSELDNKHGLYNRNNDVTGRRGFDHNSKNRHDVGEVQSNDAQTNTIRHDGSNIFRHSYHGQDLHHNLLDGGLFSARSLAHPSWTESSVEEPEEYYSNCQICCGTPDGRASSGRRVSSGRRISPPRLMRRVKNTNMARKLGRRRLSDLTESSRDEEYFFSDEDCDRPDNGREQIFQNNEYESRVGPESNVGPESRVGTEIGSWTGSGSGVFDDVGNAGQTLTRVRLDKNDPKSGITENILSGETEEGSMDACFPRVTCDVEGNGESKKSPIGYMSLEDLKAQLASLSRNFMVSDPALVEADMCLPSLDGSHDTFEQSPLIADGNCCNDNENAGSKTLLQLSLEVQMDDEKRKSSKSESGKIMERKLERFLPSDKGKWKSNSSLYRNISTSLHIILPEILTPLGRCRQQIFQSPRKSKKFQRTRRLSPPPYVTADMSSAVTVNSRKSNNVTFQNDVLVKLNSATSDDGCAVDEPDVLRTNNNALNLFKNERFLIEPPPSGEMYRKSVPMEGGVWEGSENANNDKEAITEPHRRIQTEQRTEKDNHFSDNQEKRAYDSNDNFWSCADYADSADIDIGEEHYSILSTSNRFSTLYENGFDKGSNGTLCDKCKIDLANINEQGDESKQNNKQSEEKYFSKLKNVFEIPHYRPRSDVHHTQPVAKTEFNQPCSKMKVFFNQCKNYEKNQPFWTDKSVNPSVKKKFYNPFVRATGESIRCKQDGSRISETRNETYLSNFGNLNTSVSDEQCTCHLTSTQPPFFSYTSNPSYYQGFECKLVRREIPSSSNTSCSSRNKIQSEFFHDPSQCCPQSHNFQHSPGSKNSKSPSTFFQNFPASSHPLKNFNCSCNNNIPSSHIIPHLINVNRIRSHQPEVLPTMPLQVSTVQPPASGVNNATSSSVNNATFSVNNNNAGNNHAYVVLQS